MPLEDKNVCPICNGKSTQTNIQGDRHYCRGCGFSASPSDFSRLSRAAIDARLLYEDLYDWLMGATAIEAIDKLKADYPHLEAERTKWEGYDE